MSATAAWQWPPRRPTAGWMRWSCCPWTSPGKARLEVRDQGSGRTLDATLDVRDPATPAVVGYQPRRRPAAGAAVGVAGGGGLPPGADVTVHLDPDGSDVLLRKGRTTRDGALLLVVLLPAAAIEPGSYAIGVERAGGGEPLAPLDAIEIRR